MKNKKVYIHRHLPRRIKFKAFRDKKSGKWLCNYKNEYFYHSDAPELLRPTISIKEIKTVQENNSLTGLMPKGEEGIDFELLDVELIVNPKKQKVHTKNKTHIFVHGGNPSTLCGIQDRDGIVFESGILVNCKKCLKKKKNRNKQ